MNQPETLEQLKAIVCSKSRMKFVTKVLYCLNFVKAMNNDNEIIKLIGCSWCSDNMHFITNSMVLGDFLNLKSNSINTNFREHGFQVITNTDIQKEFPTLQVRQWKKRVCMNGTFNSRSTPEDADNISMIEQVEPRIQVREAAPQGPVDKITEPIFNPFQNHYLTDPKSAKVEKKPFLIEIADSWPQETKKLLAGIEYKPQQVSILRTLLTLPIDQKEQNQILSSATVTWTKMFGGSPVCSMINGLQKLIPQGSKTMAQTIQMRVNFLHLLNSDMTSSQIDSESVSTRTLTFDNFVYFYIRYGLPNESMSSLEYISQAKAIEYDEENDDQQEDYEDQPAFKAGFLPLYRKQDIISAFSHSGMDHPWAIIQSKQQNRFALYTIPPSSSQPVVVYVNYNVWEDKSKKFSVQFGEDTKYTSSWDELLKMLYLKPENALPQPSFVHKVAVANAQDLQPKEESLAFPTQGAGASHLDDPDEFNSNLYNWSQFGADATYGEYEKMSQTFM